MMETKYGTYMWCNNEPIGSFANLGLVTRNIQMSALHTQNQNWTDVYCCEIPDAETLWQIFVHKDSCLPKRCVSKD